MKNIWLFLALFVGLVGCSSQTSPELVPESSNFTETSHYEDVMKVVEYARKHAQNMHYEVFGKSEQGKDLPLLVFSDQPVNTPLQAQKLDRPVVFVVANIHSGEVEGKAALLRLILELTNGRHQAWRKNLTLLLAPIYNADGNDMIDRSHRTNQYGPTGGVGTRANAEGLNLNRDFTKLAASESQGLVQNVLTRWDPVLFMDLHTTNGSAHGYHLTYAPPLHPNTDPRIVHFQRNEMVPALRRAMKKKGWEVFDYGNFPKGKPQDGWFTYSPKPRYSTNYIGLKNRLGLLSETYSYVDFETRIDVAEDFVKSTLQFMMDNASKVHALKTELDDAYASYSDTLQGGISFDYIEHPATFDLLTCDLDTAYQKDVGKEMYMRMGIEDTVQSKLFNRFRSTKKRAVPFAYALDNRSGMYDHLLKNLAMHGISYYRATKANDIEVQRFSVDKVEQARQYEGRQMQALSGEFKTKEISLADWVIIPTSNTSRMLIFSLLEPESEDGYVAWHMMGDSLGSQPFPVVKIDHEVNLR